MTRREGVSDAIEALQVWPHPQELSDTAKSLRTRLKNSNLLLSI